MIVTLTVRGQGQNKSTLELDSDDILSALKVGGNTVVTLNSGTQYTVLEDLPDIELQYTIGGVDLPTGKDRRFVQIGIPAALALLLDANNIPTLRVFANRALANDNQFNNLAAALGLSLTQLAAYLMRAYGVNGYLPNSVQLPAIQSKKA